MNPLSKQLQALTIQLTILPDQVIILADKFHHAILAGLAGRQSPLKMLPSYISKPSCNEVGTFLALDFGGTNVRVLLAELLGQGLFKVHDHIGVPLKDKDGHYNYISNQSTADQLFDYIALQIGAVVKQDNSYPLGHTFSFPTRQTGLNSGTLIHWTKEIETTGMDNKNITELLTAALKRQGLTNVLPQAIINDTVGTLLTAAYIDPSADIGSICGTGHNTAYLEPSSPLTLCPMIINLESGNFNQLPFTGYDLQLDAHSEKPGNQLLEKMVSGHYVGELVRIIACNLFRDGLLSGCRDRDRLTVPYLLNGAHISLLQADDSTDLTLIARWLENSLSIKNSSAFDRQVLKSIASLVCTRSAQLVAATYLGILTHIDPQLENHHTIAIDGSLYEKMPGYAEAIQTTLSQALGTKSEHVTTKLTKDGSGIGAAIATAIAATMPQ
ncbi:MAG: hexokinase [Sporomusaceae bacterium]|nr:hexokinase [Sporomusaceae bacterium]